MRALHLEVTCMQCMQLTLYPNYGGPTVGQQLVASHCCAPQPSQAATPSPGLWQPHHPNNAKTLQGQRPRHHHSNPTDSSGDFTTRRREASIRGGMQAWVEVEVRLFMAKWWDRGSKYHKPLLQGAFCLSESLRNLHFHLCWGWWACEALESPNFGCRTHPIALF